MKDPYEHIKAARPEFNTLYGDDMKNQIIEMPKENIPAIQPAQSDAMLLMIERVAANPDSDIAKMEKLLEMRNQELARVAKQAFASDFAKMAPNLPLVTKTKNNTQTKSKYAALEDINQQVNPILSEFGFATSTRVSAQNPDSVTVEAVLWHRGGHTETTQVTMPLDRAGIQGTVNKTNVHATSSSITYAKRVAICALLNISTGDDTDGNKPNDDDDLASLSQRQAIHNLYEKLNEGHKKSFIEKFGAVVELKKKHVDAAIAIMNNSIKGYKNATSN